MTDWADARALVGAVNCAALVLIALTLAVWGGSAANWPVPAWAEGLFPISWPQPARVLWWLVVGAAALVM